MCKVIDYVKRLYQSPVLYLAFSRCHFRTSHRDSDPAVAIAFANFLKALYFMRKRTWMLHTI